jgi:hypothetical protein
MKTLQIAVSDEEEKILSELARDAGYVDCEAYVNDLLSMFVCEANGDPPSTVRSHEELERELRRGIDSGHGTPVTPDFWKELLAELRLRIEERTRRPPRRATS